MRTIRFWITLSYCLFAIAIFASAQGRKPGLWELTTVMTWQQSPFPPGTPASVAALGAAGGAHTTQVCLTQEQIDKYGAIVPDSHSGDCKVTNVVKSSNGMTADWLCSGRMSGKGTLESTFYADGRAKGKVHFIGSLQAGPNPLPVEWTAESTSVFKGTDCGAVKPRPMSDK